MKKWNRLTNKLWFTMSKRREVATCQIEPLMLRAEDAAKLCGLAVSTWHEYRAAGRVPPSIKLGKARLWRLDVLRRWVEMNCPNIDQFAAMEKICQQK